MSDIETKDIDDFTAPQSEGDITPEHRAWMNEQIEATLAKKKAGTMKFRSLDDVMRKFGFNAR
ncbi:MAG: hypothetical protein AAF530_19975 [Pseudomonadota bacterium]